MDFTVENMCGFLIRSRLMTPEEMRAMYQRWLADAKDGASQIGPFAKWLVAQQFVTEYQASLLTKGHADPNDYFLNQYQILDRLGRGRMAGVYKALHNLGQMVAIKVLPPSRSKNPQLFARFQREAQMAQKLKHPNVVRTFQTGEANNLHYLVMEFLDGETLDEVLNRRKKLPPNEAVRLLHQALQGLQHIHEQGMVHRDLKPSNLMLTPAPARGQPDNTLQATIKILDIGLGRPIDDANNALGNLDLTGEGVLLGTPDYLAPEQARDPRAIDIRADIYSLGCVLYHCLTGQPPFPDKNLLNQMVRHATETPRPLKDFNPAIPDGLQQIVNWMMAKKPEERYPTPERAAQALQVFLMADSPAPRPSEETPQLKRFLTYLATGDTAGADINKPLRPAAIPMAAPGPAPLPVPASVPVAAPYAPPLASAPATAPPMAAAAPAARPLATPSPSTSPRESKEQREHRKHKHKHKHKHRDHSGQAPVAQPLTAPPTGTPVGLPTGASASPSPGEFDVELVPLEQLPPSARKKTLGLLPRDWFFLGIGAGGMMFLGLLIYLVTTIFGGGGGTAE